MTLRTLLITLLLALTTAAFAQDDGERETKKTPAMREKVYTLLSEAQALLEEEENSAGALAKLAQLEKMKDLNTYELAQMWTFYGYVYFQQENYSGARRAYENVLKQDPPEALQVSTIYTLAQLSFVTEDYDGAVKYLKDWFKVALNPGPDPYILLCQGMYQQAANLDGEAAKKRYREAIVPCQDGIALAQERGTEVKENWYLLLRTFYYELGDFPNMLAVLETLITTWPKKEYWIQLSGVYGELGQEKNQLAAYEIAFKQGFLSRGSEVVTLAQLFMQAGVPYKAAKILDDGINNTKMVESDERNNRLLAQAWMLAAEDEKAITPLQRAASLTSGGEMDYRLAQTYFNLDQYDNAIDAANEALRKGSLKRRDAVNVLLGMAHFNEKNYQESLKSFREATKDDRSAQLARQWVNHVQSEIDREAQLRAALRGR
ncbi:MAG: tetratricopeptide repeat protein [Pseudomonadota bacterium]